jgi:hypothetical protein
VNKIAIAAFSVALSGCTVALHGHQSAGSGGTATLTGTAVGTQASGGPAAVKASFGAPVSGAAPGGHLVVSNGAAAVLVLGLVVAETMSYLSGAASRPATRPQHPIAHTCSCYGWTPGGERGDAAAGD